MDYDFDVAVNGREAVQKSRDYRPDIIIHDIMMPVMDGYEACKLIKAEPETRNIPIIMATALNDREAKLNGLAAGTNEYLSKPIDQTELSIRVENLLKIKSAEDLMLRHSQILKDE